jgi:homoserine kinase
MYSREDAVFNIQRSALLIAAMLTQTTDAFHEALMDRLHQPYRAPLVPGLQEMLELRAPGLLGCALSGAGPSVLVFYERGHESVCEKMREIFARHGHASEILPAHIPDHGYDLMHGL